MSSKSPSAPRQGRAAAGKAGRYIQPSLLLGLRGKPSYGYELIQSLPDFGFVEGQAPPGMIYRHLRELEAAGLVTSSWHTPDAGPARRVYELTPEGEAALALWVEYMEQQAERLAGFIEAYRQAVKPKTPRRGRQRSPSS